jgi:DNA invertase Pin-like site-specific DNA recombinase
MPTLRVIGYVRVSTEEQATGGFSLDAQEAKIRRGERCGRLRFGYDLGPDGKTLIPNPREQEAIVRMRAWRAQGKTYRDLVRLVEDLEIDTKGGGIWRPQTIRQILTRPVA